ncbi:MAG TPA: aldolase [Phycisphaerales bacterium]|nr:aldolase [Phycisphaerales bacterium]
MGLDFVFIDTEHIALNRSDLSWMCRTYSAMNLSPLVRIPSPDPNQATMALDGGAVGVIAPYVETVEQVKALVGAIKYRPLKGQVLQAVLAGQSPEGIEPTLDYAQKRCEDNVAIVNIESMPAMRYLDEILKVKGLDAVLIGPHDLSCSMGLSEQYDHPTFVAAVDEIIDKARAAGVGVGIHIMDMEAESYWIKRGLNLVIHGGDGMIFRKYMQQEIAQLRKVAGRQVQSSSTAVVV